MKKILALVLALIMVLAVFAGCGSKKEDAPADTPAEEPKTEAPADAVIEDDGAPEKPEKITVWMQKTFNEEFNNLFAGLFQEFGEANGIEVSTEIIDPADLRDTKLPAALESGDTPNIAYIEPAALVAYANAGVLVSAQPTIDELKANGTEFYPALLDTTFVNGECYAVPFSAQSWLIWYRKDKLEAAGYDHAPETWEEMLEMSIATTDPSTGFYGAGLAAGATASDFNNLSQSILWSYGGSVMKDGKLNIDSPESKEALKMLLRFFEEGTVAPDMVAGDDMANNTAFLTGSATFVGNIGTLAGALQSDAPDIWEVTGVCPMPAGPEGSYPLVAVNMMALIDKSESENYWAQKCLAYATDKSRLGEIMAMIAPAYGMVYEGTLENEEYMADPTTAALMEAISTGKYYSYPDAEFSNGRAALTASSSFVNNIISWVVVDGMTLDDAIAKQVELCNGILADVE